MTNETITILPAADLDKFLAGHHPADILGIPTPLDFEIGNGFDPEPRKTACIGRNRGNATPRSIRRKIAMAEDIHQGITDKTAGTL